MEKLRNFLGYSHELMHTVVYDKYPCCRMSVTNEHLWNTLNNYGCTPRKSLTLKFPDDSIFKDKSLIRHFIRGYVDGDGCLTWRDTSHTKPGIDILGTEHFLNMMQSYFPVGKRKLYIKHKDQTKCLVY